MTGRDDRIADAATLDAEFAVNWPTYYDNVVDWDVATLMNCYRGFDAHIDELRRKQQFVKVLIDRKATDRCPECGSPFVEEQRFPCDDGPNEWHTS